MRHDTQLDLWSSPDWLASQHKDAAHSAREGGDIDRAEWHEAEYQRLRRLCDDVHD